MVVVSARQKSTGENKTAQSPGKTRQFAAARELGERSERPTGAQQRDDLALDLRVEPGRPQENVGEVRDRN